MPIPRPVGGSRSCSGGQWGLDTEWLGLPRVSALRAGPSRGKSPHVISQREGLVLVAGGEGQGPWPVSRAPRQGVLQSRF